MREGLHDFRVLERQQTYQDLSPASELVCWSKWLASHKA